MSMSTQAQSSAIAPLLRKDHIEMSVAVIPYQSPSVVVEVRRCVVSVAVSMCFHVVS
jgi:hypothetical protein